MDYPEGAGSQLPGRVDFDRRVRLELRGAQISSDCGVLVMREPCPPSAPMGQFGMFA
jgi:hypothetical protein